MQAFASDDVDRDGEMADSTSSLRRPQYVALAIPVADRRSVVVAREYVALAIPVADRRSVVVAREYDAFPATVPPSLRFLGGNW